MSPNHKDFSRIRGIDQRMRLNRPNDMHHTGNYRQTGTASAEDNKDSHLGWFQRGSEGEDVVMLRAKFAGQRLQEAGFVAGNQGQVEVTERADAGLRVHAGVRGAHHLIQFGAYVAGEGGRGRGVGGEGSRHGGGPQRAFWGGAQTVGGQRWGGLHREAERSGRPAGHTLEMRIKRD